MKKTKEERKTNLRDWMTATTQFLKCGAQVGLPYCLSNDKIKNSDDITFWWKSIFGINMRSKWVEKALYGKKV
jgi:hypothetical protein